MDTTVKLYVAMALTDTVRTFLTDAVREELSVFDDIVWHDDLATLTPAEQAARLADRTVMLTGWGQPECTDAYLDRMPALRLIAHTAGSVATIGTPAAYARQIRVTSGNDVFARSVAEATLAYILCMLRELPKHDARMKDGLWREEPFYNEGLFNRRIGLVGFGAIPRFLIPMLAPFDCVIDAYDPYVDAETMHTFGVTKHTLDHVVMDKDIVSLHLPLTPDTVGLIDRSLLGRMADRTLVVNTARGAILDEGALAEELHAGRLRAALDVFSEEPLPSDHPLRTAPGTLLIPHMAGPTLDRRAEAARSVLRDIHRFASGVPMHHEVTAQHAGRMTRVLSTTDMRTPKP